MITLSTRRGDQLALPENFEAIARLLSADHGRQNLFERLATVRELVTGRIVFSTSFGLEDQAIAHAIFVQDVAIDVVTLDTGRLFPETYEVWAETEQRYGRRIAAFAPDVRSIESFIARHGINGFRSSVDARQCCCNIRKVAPLERALESASGWIAGLRADQSAGRAVMPYAAVDPERRLCKIHPILDWSRSRVADFVRDHRIPYNPLHDRGFLSIGCAPCTRAIAPGEPERAGRWWWEQDQKKECGLHRPSPPSAAPGTSVRV